MTITTRAAGVLLTAVLTAGLTSCGSSSHPDVAACKTAMKQAFATALVNPSAPPATRPPACKGVDNKTLERLAAEIMQGK